MGAANHIQDDGWSRALPFLTQAFAYLSERLSMLGVHVATIDHVCVGLVITQHLLRESLRSLSKVGEPRFAQMLEEYQNKVFLRDRKPNSFLRWQGIALSGELLDLFESVTQTASEIGILPSPHLLLAQVQTLFPESTTALWLSGLGIEPDVLMGIWHGESSNLKRVRITTTKVNESEPPPGLIDMSQQADQFHPLVGRDEEMNHLIQALLHYSRNFPVLIGAPGVGKTAMVEGLVRAISKGEVPLPLKGTKIYALPYASFQDLWRDSSSVQSVSKMLDFIKGARAVLFLDEVHAFLGGGGSPAEMVFANILKPMLARGEIRVVGTTTPEEYSLMLRRNPPLERRVIPIYLKEPSSEKAHQILLAVAKRMQDHYRIAIDDDIVAECVQMCHRFLPHLAFPDKAIDLLDSAAAYHWLHRCTGKLEKDDLRQALRQRFGSNPIGLSASPEDDLRALSASLNQSILGQEEAIARIISALWRRHLDNGAETPRPASFLFVGGHGVGKTYAAQALANHLFGGAISVIDLSDMSDSASLARLIGAPPGYIGFDTTPALVSAVRRNPLQVLLLENVHLAHPNVQGYLAQAIKAGKFTTAQDQTIHFGSGIIILTATLEKPLRGFAVGGEHNPLGSDFPLPVLSELRDASDEVVYFAPLSDVHRREIAARALNDLASKYRAQTGIELLWDEDELQSILASSKPSEGGTGVLKAVRRLVEQTVAALLNDNGSLPRQIRLHMQHTTAMRHS